jgi:hypothetical protein
VTPRPAGLVVVAAAAVLTLSSCADTVVEVDQAAEATSGGSVVPATTLPITGTATELLPELAIEMSRLSSLIAADGDERAALQRIEALWAAAQPEVEQSRPDLVGGMQTTVDMARNSVTRIRPADADKAFSLLTDLVDRYTGDG